MAVAEKCLPIDVMCNAKNGLSNAVTGAVGDATDNLANQVLEAFASVIASLGTLWVNVGTPNLTNTGGASSVDGASAPGIRELTTVLGYVTWVSLAVAIIALTILGALIATRIRTGEGIASLGKVGLILGGVALVGGAGSIVSALLPNGPVGVSGTVAFLQSSLWPYMLIAAALSVVVGGARMFWESRAEPGKDLLRSLLTLAVVGGAGVTVVALLVTAADRFSVWVINNSLACDVTAADGACFKENVGELLGLGAATAGVPGQVSLSSVLVIIFGLIAILASVVQIVLMVARSGMLVILAGILPLAASFTNTEMGRSWFRKCIGWLIAFTLYKPAAAVVYAAAFQLTGTDVFADDGSGILAVVTGLMLMVLALFAMPALMRFVTPMVSSLASGAGGAAAAAGALAALPTGAAALGRLGGGGGGGNISTQSNAAPQTTTHNTNTSTTSITTGPTGSGDSGAGRGGSTAPTPTGAPTAAASGNAATGGPATGGATAGGAAATGAGAAAGPAGAALAAGLQAGQAASSAAKNTAAQVTGDGPSGSN